MPHWPFQLKRVCVIAVTTTASTDKTTPLPGIGGAYDNDAADSNVEQNDADGDGPRRT